MTKDKAEIMVDEIEHRFSDVFASYDRRKYLATNGDKRYDYMIKVIGKSGNMVYFKSHIDWLEFLERLEVFGIEERS